MHSGSELDLPIVKDGRRIGVEVTRADTPALTRPMQVAIHDLKLHQLQVIYPGLRTYRLADNVIANLFLTPKPLKNFCSKKLNLREKVGGSMEIHFVTHAWHYIPSHS